MGNYKYTFSEIDLNTVFNSDALSEKDSILIDNFNINSLFDQRKDLIEVHYYSLDGRLLDSTLATPNQQTNQDSETANNGTLNTVSLRVQDDLVSKGYTFGDIYLVYNFINNPYTNKDLNSPFFIEEISSDRKEVRLLSTVLNNTVLLETTSKIKLNLDIPDSPQYYLNLGENRLLIITNIDTLPYKGGESIIIKLYNPLPEDVVAKTPLNISQKVANSIGYQAFAELISEVIKPTYLKGPNFNVNVEEDTEQPTQFFNIGELFGYPVTSSFYEVKSAFEEKGAELSIDYSDYTNFINFSSAQERLENFKYKFDLIQTYRSQSNSIYTANNTEGGITGSREYYDGLINNILSNFDHYDRFLYYESSSYSWPKTGVRKPYTLVTGSAATGSGSWYETQLTSASVFDSSNPHSLENTIPEFLREDPNNTKYLKFIHMIGQHFDNLWLYTKAVSDKYDGDNRLDHGISKDLIQDALKNFGVKLYSSNKSTQELFNIFTGNFYEMTSEEFGSRLPSASFITGSDQSTSEENYRKEIYKRLYHNLPLLTKAKGTERGVRALLSTFGIPSLYSSGSHSGLTINQIGGTISGSFNLGGDQYVTSSSDRIKIDNTGSIIEGNVLSQYSSIQKANSKYAKDYNLIEAGFSPANYLNNLTLASASLDGFDIEDVLGDPRLDQSSSYDALIAKAKEYLTPISSTPYDIKDFVRIIKFYDNVLFKTITDFLPARANVSTGIIIKPHLLERSKVKQVQVKSSDREYLSGSYLKTDNQNFSLLKKQLVGDLTLTGSISIGTTSGSHGQVYEIGGGEKDTAYSSSAMTPFGPALLSYHTHNEAKYDGELSGSGIVLSTGELNDENPFKYTNPNTSFFKVGTTTNCQAPVIVDNINVTPTPTATAVCQGTVTAENINGTPSTPTPTPTAATPTPTATETATPTPTPTETATPTPTPTETATPTTTPTETATTSPAPTYYRFENCTTTALVFQTLPSEPSINDRYTDGIDNFIYDGTSTTLPGTIVTNLSGPIGTGCFNATPTPTPTPTVENVLIYEQSGGGGWSSSGDACSGTGGTSIVNLYRAPGTTSPLYTNIDQTIPFPGGNTWYQLQGTTDVVLIDSSGDITQTFDCSVPTPTPTPTPTCNSSLVTYDGDQPAFSSASVLYNQGTTNNASPGYYLLADNTTWRFWNGSSFTSSGSDPCTGGPV